MCQAPSQLPSHWTWSFGKGRSLPEQCVYLMLFVRKCPCRIVPGCCSSFRGQHTVTVCQAILTLYGVSMLICQSCLTGNFGSLPVDYTGNSFGRLRRQSYLVPCKAPVRLLGPVLLANELKSWKFYGCCVVKDQWSRKTAAHNNRVLWLLFFFFLCLRFYYCYWKLLQFRAELIKLGECTCWIPENGVDGQPSCIW